MSRSICYDSEKVIDNSLRSITFVVGGEFTLPTFYRMCGEAEFQRALEFGAELLEVEKGLINERATESVIGNSLDELKKKHLGELGRKEDSWRRQLEEGQEELRVLRGELTSLQNDFDSRLRLQLEYMGTGHAAEVGRLRQLISELESGRSVVATETRAAVLAELDSIQTAVLKEKDNMISYLREKEEGLTAKVDSLQEAMISRTKSGANAALMGRSGEEDFCSVMGDCGVELERTAGESHMCDYRGTISDYTVLFEVKNHKERILVKEVTKFRRDMKEHPDVRCGVFVGLNAMYSRAGIDGICGNGLFGIEVTAEKQLLVYIGEFFGLGGGSSCAAGDSSWLIGVLRSLIEGICPTLEKLGENDNSLVAELEGRIRAAVGCVQSVGERARVLYNKIINDRKAADDAFVGSLGAVKMMREEIQMLLGVLLGNAVFVPDTSCETDSKTIPGWGSCEGVERAEGVDNNEYDMANSVIMNESILIENGVVPKKRGGGGKKKKV